MRRASGLIDVEPVAAAVPDMVEVIRFVVDAGRGPALVVLRRKISGALQAQLRDMAVALVDDA